MAIFALADPHLSFGVPEKSMEVFGAAWKGYTTKIESEWRRLVKKEDLVLIAGDISWGMRLEEAMADLAWIDALPGTKLISRGNHDYWWPSSSKLKKALPPSIHFIHNSTFEWKDVTIGGARLWDSPEYSFHPYIQFVENPRAAAPTMNYEESKEHDEKIFNRELERLRLSLQGLSSKARKRIAMTHYPPIGADLKPSRASQILEEFRIDLCIFGHLHNLKKGAPLFGTARGVNYLLTSCDYLDFIPLRVL